MNIFKVQTRFLTVVTLMLLVGALAGCAKNGAKADAQLDKMQTSFASADPAIKAVVDKSLADAKASNYRGAFDDLVPLLKNPKVTPEQLDALRESMHQLSLMFPPPTPSSFVPKS